MNKKEVKFKRQLVWFDNAAYYRAVKDAQIKISLLEDCIAWVKYHLTDINIEEFEKGMVSYFYTQLGEQKKEFAKLNIKAEKIAGLLDINVAELNKLSDIYNNAVGSIKFTKGTPEVNVTKETFNTYTETQQQNEELLVANELISAIEKLQKIRSVYPIPIVNSFGGFLNYHQGTQQWKLNTSNY